jgi:hypothetical protein
VSFSQPECMLMLCVTVFSCRSDVVYLIHFFYTLCWFRSLGIWVSKSCRPQRHQLNDDA